VFSPLKTDESIPLLLGSQTRRKTMLKTSTFALIAAVVAVSVASPVLAQSRDNGRDAYAMVPHGDGANAPGLTGGGSSGYNADIGKKSD
jgi:hypothetical protein